jgi:2'-5' RNA ligase
MVEQQRGVIGNLAVWERLSFRLVWLVSSAQLRLSAGSALHSLPPSGPDAALHYTVMIRPPAHAVTSVVAALERLRGISSHHYFYPADSMHVTVGGVSRFLSDGSNAAARLAELRAIIGSYPSFDLTLRGLNVSPFTIFAQVIPHSRTLRALRTDLRMLSRQAGEAIGFGDYVRDFLPHMNIVRFSGRVTADFLEEVSASRQEWFGRWTVREVEVIRTDTLLSREGREVLARIPLAPIHRSA